MKLLQNDKGWWVIVHNIPISYVKAYIAEHHTRIYVTSGDITVLADYHEGAILECAMRFSEYFNQELELE